MENEYVTPEEKERLNNIYEEAFMEMNAVKEGREASDSFNKLYSLLDEQIEKSKKDPTIHEKTYRRIYVSGMQGLTLAALHLSKDLLTTVMSDAVSMAESDTANRILDATEATLKGYERTEDYLRDQIADKLIDTAVKEAYKNGDQETKNFLEHASHSKKFKLKARDIVKDSEAFQELFKDSDFKTLSRAYHSKELYTNYLKKYKNVEKKNEAVKKDARKALSTDSKKKKEREAASLKRNDNLHL